jgi:hypothetical protein
MSSEYNQNEDSQIFSMHMNHLAINVKRQIGMSPIFSGILPETKVTRHEQIIL